MTRIHNTCRKGKNKAGVVITIMLAAAALGSCTERRTAAAPVPDGDTVRVEVPGLKARQSEGGRRVIVVGPEATPADPSELSDFPDRSE